MSNKAKTKRHHKRWLKKHPEYQIFRLRRWIGKEKDPRELVIAKIHLKRFLDREKQEAQLNQKQKS